MSTGRRGAAWGVLVLLGLAMLSGCERGSPQAQQPQEKAPVVLGPDDVVRVEPRTLESGPVLSGTLQARRAATMRAEVQGAVLEMLVEQGQKVKKGQLLARIEDTSLQDQLIAARSAVRVARSGLQVARTEEERNRKLADAGVITRRELARVELARYQAQAQLSEAEARLALARQQVGRTRIRAPFAGVVSERLASAGDIVQPGTGLYTVIDPTSLRLEASVPAAQLSVLEPGVGVDFNVAGFGERSFEGRIEQVNPAVDPGTGQVRIYVALPNTEQVLLTGLSAEGRVAALRREVPAVPVSAVDVRAEPPTVLRVKDGRVERVQVKLGMTDELERLVELRSGVQPGDVLLRTSSGDVAEGTPVELRLPARPQEPGPGVGGGGTPPDESPPQQSVPR
ncbi:efflux transporter periplasmic adaptor subunit [Archangium sp. Cb G35]|uniref:efflux RND transporter periplasmic adaptor subunit n=1 Tax=Archangium sp. Cb G35 TaxID=1920190 RepID=UPI000935A887|nr:efflux RND transporter periplasmic adaptor subunit [Archangium sp. Cb G35]OJT25357.1 efflux transporter periplasmic adaptor subunit [Archangium sp. Cb G35]